MVSSNMALRWVPYPTQVVGKSAKPIPVMLLGVLIGRKSYSLQRYFFVFLIVVGVVLFMMKEGNANHGTAADNVGIGEVLLFLSLAMDGLTGAIQERMRAASSPSAQHMMLSMNSWSTGILAVGLLLSGELFEFIYFAGKYPYVLLQLASLAVTGALGQLFIFMMVNVDEDNFKFIVSLNYSIIFNWFQVSSFGPLACSVVTTTRKFFTVLCSVLFFGNSLTSRQWLGAVIVFSGLFADIMFGKKPTSKAKSTSTKIENRKLIS